MSNIIPRIPFISQIVSDPLLARKLCSKYVNKLSLDSVDIFPYSLKIIKTKKIVKSFIIEEIENLPFLKRYILCFRIFKTLKKLPQDTLTELGLCCHNLSNIMIKNINPRQLKILLAQRHPRNIVLDLQYDRSMLPEKTKRICRNLYLRCAEKIARTIVPLSLTIYAFFDEDFVEFLHYFKVPLSSNTNLISSTFAIKERVNNIDNGIISALARESYLTLKHLLVQARLEINFVKMAIENWHSLKSIDNLQIGLYKASESDYSFISNVERFKSITKLNLDIRSLTVEGTRSFLNNFKLPKQLKEIKMKIMSIEWKGNTKKGETIQLISTSDEVQSFLRSWEGLSYLEKVFISFDANTIPNNMANEILAQIIKRLQKPKLIDIECLKNYIDMRPTRRDIAFRKNAFDISFLFKEASHIFSTLECLELEFPGITFKKLEESFKPPTGIMNKISLKWSIFDGKKLNKLISATLFPALDAEKSDAENKPHISLKEIFIENGEDFRLVLQNTNYLERVEGTFKVDCLNIDEDTFTENILAWINSKKGNIEVKITYILKQLSREKAKIIAQALWDSRIFSEIFIEKHPSGYIMTYHRGTGYFLYDEEGQLEESRLEV